jgi:hypothetical protein
VRFHRHRWEPYPLYAQLTRRLVGDPLVVRCTRCGAVKDRLFGVYPADLQPPRGLFARLLPLSPFGFYLETATPAFRYGRPRVRRGGNYER